MPQMRGEGGFTLIEVLMSMVILALIVVALAAVSVTFLVQVGDQAQTRQGEATTAQWSSMVFARDVQGASGVVSECAPMAGSTHLLTLASSHASSSRVEYRRSNSGPYSLIRSECAVGPGATTSRKVVDELAQAPTVECDSMTCVAGQSPAPRTITLKISQSDSFSFELDGVRRTTDSNSTAPPMEMPKFLSLAGSGPLTIGGSSRLEVDGAAYINRPVSGSNAIQFNGGSRLSVSGDFKLEVGGQCSGCATNSDKQPGSYPKAVPDPLRFLPAPDASVLVERTNCPKVGSQWVCEPGIYTTELKVNGNKAYRLQPGVYVLRSGLSVQNGSLTGSGVLLYNQKGGISVNGAGIDLSPMTTGVYADILIFQARSNSAEIQINGNATLASLTGLIYAPKSNGVVLGGGGGTLRVGGVVGANLSTSGSGTVIVGGS